MASDTQASAFLTGATGFIGSALLTLLVARQHRVCALADSAESAEHVRRAGAVPIIGDLLRPGPWQDEAAADWIFHIPTHDFDVRRQTRRQAASIARVQIEKDTHLLEAVAGGSTHRIVYVADTSCYGPTGARPITECAPLQHAGWGRCLTPTLEHLDGYVFAGQPVIAALPGCVYGNGGWFRKRIIQPVMAGRPVFTFSRSGPWLSPIHVEDCARALVHLAEHGKPGSRYFVVNHDPVQWNEFAERFAQLAHRRLRTICVPPAAARVVLGPVVADHLGANAVFSNARLRAISFRYLYPTLNHGIHQVLRELQ